MPFLREPPKLQEVFLLATPGHMLQKLFWEVRQFKTSLADTDGVLPNVDPCYSAFNYAITALHCADWAWSAAGPESKDYLGNTFSFSVTGNDREDLLAFSDALGKQNRDFYICRQIANGSKHMRRGPRPHSVHAALEFTQWSDDPQRVRLFDLVIRDGDKIFSAAEIFHRMAEFWEQLYRNVGFLEDKFIEGV
jgi:hypothetical protein